MFPGTPVAYDLKACNFTNVSMGILLSYAGLVLFFSIACCRNLFNIWTFMLPVVFVAAILFILNFTSYGESLGSILLIAFWVLCKIKPF
jgi:hypothetical protein